MATRAVIELEGMNLVSLYKHWDGYPSATLPWLLHFASENGVRSDIDYAFAQLIRSSAFDGEKFGLGQSRSTGWGVIPKGADYGTDFRYVINRDGTVDVFDDWRKTKITDTQMVQDIINEFNLVK